VTQLTKSNDEIDDVETETDIENDKKLPEKA